MSLPSVEPVFFGFARNNRINNGMSGQHCLRDFSTDGVGEGRDMELVLGRFVSDVSLQRKMLRRG